MSSQQCGIITTLCQLILLYIDCHKSQGVDNTMKKSSQNLLGKLLFHSWNKSYLPSAPTAHLNFYWKKIRRHQNRAFSNTKSVNLFTSAPIFSLLQGILLLQLCPLLLKSTALLSALSNYYQYATCSKSLILKQVNKEFQLFKH